MSRISSNLHRVREEKEQKKTICCASLQEHDDDAQNMIARRTCRLGCSNFQMWVVILYLINQVLF